MIESRKQEDDMLILTRRVGETVMIGDNVTVTVSDELLSDRPPAVWTSTA